MIEVLREELTTGKAPRLTVSEMAAGKAAHLDPPTEARIQEAASHRTGNRRDREIAEIRDRLGKVECALAKEREIVAELQNHTQITAEQLAERHLENKSLRDELHKEREANQEREERIANAEAGMVSMWAIVQKLQRGESA
jgi:regulator of replication initiation timing